MDNEQLLELISVFLEERGFKIYFMDGELFVDQEDTDLGLKVTVDVVA